MASAVSTGSNGANVRIVRGGFSASESDAFVNDQRMTFFPKIVINKGIEFFMAMDLAGIRQKYNHRDVQTNGPMERWYEDRASRNAFDTAMIPSITQYRLTAHLPWGTLSVGATKDYPFGTGALLANNTRASALVLVIPYGPFRIAPAIWLARSWAQDGYASYNPQPANNAGDPLALSYQLPVYTTNPDSATKNQLYVGPFMTYANGPIELGWTPIYRLWHVNAYENLQAQRITTTALRGNGYDGVDLINVFYGKYNNGRFFANAEYGFQQVDAYFLGSYPSFTERSYAFAEGGALCGPAKISMMFGWSGGDALNDNNVTKTYSGFAINYRAMLPYQYLMFYTYAGGNDAPWLSTGPAAFTVDENGQMGDAYALAARLDYAVAANLNIWGSYLWAHRVEQNGYRRGYKLSSGGAATTAQATAWKNLWFGANASPYVDDGYLGWEMGFGVDWKLLEGLNFRSRWAYWQPGSWFDQAYQAVGINGATDAYMSSRSSINAFEGSLEVNF
jgi:hypothetical protein